MLEVAGRPVLHHLMEIYAVQGVTSFVLAAGYRRDIIESWAATLTAEWSVQVVDTGEDADTGERLLQCLDRVGETFFATYGDGLGNVPVARTLERHRESKAGVTVTVVPLPSPYGTLHIDDDARVYDFREKPRLDDHLINAGYFVVERDALADARAAGTSLERDMLPAMAAQQRLFAYRHDGFWRSMDTHKDVLELDQLAREEGIPWMDLDRN
jgi:glucose-1-phosphate cytidylyltransferase